MNTLKLNIYLLFLISLISLISGCEEDTADTPTITEISKNDVLEKKKKERVTVCHYDDDNQIWTLKDININSIQGHLKHGDKLLVDADEDGFVEAINECVPGGDCDDNNPTIYPGASEICNGVDNNCNGEIDEGVQNQYYQDLDGDGFGSNTSIFACALPQGYSEINGDCDDTNQLVNPNASETCNGIDNNCNGMIDEGVQNQYYQDLDGDGFGSNTSIFACALPQGYSEINGDCDDTNNMVHPNSDEICDNQIDDNCNNETDENCISAELRRRIEILENSNIRIGVLTGEDGKLFGSFTPLQLSNAIRQQLLLDIDRRQITFPVIKEIGTYQAVIRFSSTISAIIRFELFAS